RALAGRVDRAHAVVRVATGFPVDEPRRRRLRDQHAVAQHSVRGRSRDRLPGDAHGRAYACGANVLGRAWHGYLRRYVVVRHPFTEGVVLDREQGVRPVAVDPGDAATLRAIAVFGCGDRFEDSAVIYPNGCGVCVQHNSHGCVLDGQIGAAVVVDVGKKDTLRPAPRLRRGRP